MLRSVESSSSFALLYRFLLSRYSSEIFACFSILFNNPFARSFFGWGTVTVPDFFRC